MKGADVELRIRNAASSVCGIGSHARPKPGYPLRDITELSKSDLQRFCVCGSERARREFIMELALRQAETGEKLLAIATNGGYSPLAEYIPQLRIYRVGDFTSVNIFSIPTSPNRHSVAISDMVGGIFRLSRDERAYLMRGIDMTYADGIRAPSMREIGDRLLQIQAEVQPKEAYKVECLKNVLWELESGPIGAMSDSEGEAITLPAVIDLEPLPSWRERALVAMVLMERGLEIGMTTLVIDPADWLQQDPLGMDKVFPTRHWLGRMGEGGKAVCFGVTSPNNSYGFLGGMTSIFFCGPIWREELGIVEGGFRLGSEVLRSLRGLQDGAVLACTSGRESPFLVRLKGPPFRALSPQEVAEHMRLLGEDVKPLAQSKARRERMLEKIFTDRAALVYAWELLRLIQSGRVAVESVIQQRNATIKAVVKTLKRYFMIVEFTDSTGSGCYRLTKAGERAIGEMEGGGEGDKGKECGA